MERKRIRKYVPPAFFVMLAVSLTMWWLTQLGKTHTNVEIPVTVEVGDNVLEVSCYASGTGYKLAGHRLLGRAKVRVTFDELNITPSPIRHGWGIVNPGSLATAIEKHIHDVKILSVVSAPEIFYGEL